MSTDSVHPTDSEMDALKTMNDRDRNLIKFALWRFAQDAHSNAMAAAQDKERRFYKHGSAEAFARDAEDAEKLRAHLDQLAPTRSQKLAAAGFARRPSLWAFEARAALELIAAPMRPDGSWNRDRAACQQIAAEALGWYDDSAAPDRPAPEAQPVAVWKPTPIVAPGEPGQTLTAVRLQVTHDYDPNGFPLSLSDASGEWKASLLPDGTLRVYDGDGSPPRYGLHGNYTARPGSFATLEAARAAQGLPDDALQALQDAANARTGGAGGVITLADVEAARK